MEMAEIQKTCKLSSPLLKERYLEQHSKVLLRNVSRGRYVACFTTENDHERVTQRVTVR